MTEDSHSHMYMHRLAMCSMKPKSIFFYSNGTGRQAIGKEGSLSLFESNCSQDKCLKK